MARHPELFPQTKSRRGSGGRRADLDDRYFRSSWEANYARYLNWQIARGLIVRWEYEVDTFEFPVKRGSRLYVPDFKVWETPERYRYDEVKGYMDPRSATKLDRMGRYYPNITLRLIDKIVYRGIAESMSRILPNWEHGRQ